MGNVSSRKTPDARSAREKARRNLRNSLLEIFPGCFVKVFLPNDVGSFNSESYAACVVKQQRKFQIEGKCPNKLLAEARTLAQSWLG
jgi:hypothetical protein